MIGASGQRILMVLCGLAAVTAAGCADLDILPSWVPFQGPASRSTAGGGDAGRANRRTAEALGQKAAAGSAEERQRISQQLVGVDPDGEGPADPRGNHSRLRAGIPSPAAEAILKAALADADTHVRVAACEAWGKRGDAQAVSLLSEALRSDVDADVRLAAAKALGETKNPEAVAALGEALADADPAMQYRAVLSLKKVTGKDLGNDVDRWQQYVKGELPEPTPSLAERIRRLF